MVRTGTTLVEVIVALVLAGIGLSAIARAGHMAARLSVRAQAMTSALAHAGAIADSLAAVGTVRTDSVRVDGVSIRWNVEETTGRGTQHVLLRTAVPGQRDTFAFRLLVGPAIPELD